MSTTRPFAFNTGSTVSGTTQVGDLAVGTDRLPVSDNYGGLQWKNGPNEDLGYVIGYPQSGGTQPLPDGGFGFVQFWRSKIPGDDASFINLAEYISRKYYTPQTFATANDAKIWLNDNGFWTSYEPPITPTPTETQLIVTPTPTTTETPTPTPTITPTQTSAPGCDIEYEFITPTPTPTPSATPGDVLIDPLIVGDDEYLIVGTNEYLKY